MRTYEDVTPEELYSLYTTIAKFTLPRLKAFIEEADKWIDNPKKIDYCKEIVKALELIVRDDGAEVWTEVEKSTVEKGMQLFFENFFNLWY